MQNAEKDLAARTKSLARRIIRLYVALPRQPVAQVLGKQALRSGTSVGANYHAPTPGGGWLGRQFSILRRVSVKDGLYYRPAVLTELSPVPFHRKQ